MEAFLPLVRQYTDLQELNAHILNELIEKIVVHEKERDEDGNVTQQVDIYYKFIGYIDPRTMMDALLSPADDSQEAKPMAIIFWQKVKKIALFGPPWYNKGGQSYCQRCTTLKLGLYREIVLRLYQKFIYAKIIWSNEREWTRWVAAQFI